MSADICLTRYNRVIYLQLLLAPSMIFPASRKLCKGEQRDLNSLLTYLLRIKYKSLKRLRWFCINNCIFHIIIFIWSNFCKTNYIKLKALIRRLYKLLLLLQISIPMLIYYQYLSSICMELVNEYLLHSMVRNLSSIVRRNSKWHVLVLFW